MGMSTGYLVRSISRRVHTTLIDLHVAAFGFLSGVQAKDAGVTNLGMHDRKCQTLVQIYGAYTGRRTRSFPLGAEIYQCFQW